MTFEEAYKRLQEIHAMLQGDSIIDIDKIELLQKEAKECFDLCNEKLKTADEE